MRLSDRLHHVAVAVSDLKASLDWYCTKLDFGIEKRFTLPDARLEIVKLISNGGVRLELLKHEAGPAASQLRKSGLVEPGSKHICFHVADIEAAASELRQRGITLVQEPKVIKESGEKNIWIADNEGNMIEFIEEIDETEVSKEIEGV